jgi:hypothetical protein
MWHHRDGLLLRRRRLPELQEICFNFSQTELESGAGQNGVASHDHEVLKLSHTQRYNVAVLHALRRGHRNANADGRVCGRGRFKRVGVPGLWKV